jgi:hypothetical protein
MQHIFLLGVIAPLLSLAQGSGSIATPPSVSGSDAAPFRVTKRVNGVVRRITAETLTVEDAKSGKPVELLLTAGKRIRVSGAVKQIGELREGASVRVNYAADDRVLLDLRVVENGK